MNMRRLPLEGLPALRAQMGDNAALQETLNDIESMAYLGRYYADKMRGAAKLAVFRGDRQRKQFHDQAAALMYNRGAVAFFLLRQMHKRRYHHCWNEMQTAG